MLFIAPIIISARQQYIRHGGDEYTIDLEQKKLCDAAEVT